MSTWAPTRAEQAALTDEVASAHQEHERSWLPVIIGAVAIIYLVLISVIGAALA